MLHGRPCYVPLEPEPVYAVRHLPAEEPFARTAVIICAPVGWDELGAHRSLLALAAGLLRLAVLLCASTRTRRVSCLA